MVILVYFFKIFFPIAPFKSAIDAASNWTTANGFRFSQTKSCAVCLLALVLFHTRHSLCTVPLSPTVTPHLLSVLFSIAV